MNPNFPYDIDYDSVLGCYVWWHDGIGYSLGAGDLDEAEEEVLRLVSERKFPEDLQFNEYDNEGDQFRDDVEADADVLRSAGFGTDEDYGYFGGDE